MRNRKSILVDCERMKYPYTGLYYYCLYLAKNLLTTNTDHKEFCFYTRKNTQHLFNGACTLTQQSIHKFLLPPTGKFDIWHSTYQGTMYYPRNRNIKVVLTVHDLNFLYDDSKDAAKKKKYLFQLKEKIERADHVVAISNFVLEDIKKHIDIKNKACSVIYNGCTIDEIENLSPPVYKPTASFLFTIGTIVDKKNFHVLPSLLAKNNMQLLIAGVTNSEEYKNVIISEAKKWGVEERVIFTGPVSENDKQWYLKNCTAFVFPSISEGFGLPVVEAMHFGKPAIISTHTCLPEIGGNAAYYFDSFEAEAMQHTLEKTLLQYNNDCIASIKERAALFNWKRSAEEYQQVYNKLLQN